MVAGAEALGHRDREARAGTDHKAVHHEVHRAGGSHRGQGLNAQEPAHDDRIRHAVKLLEQRPEQHGQGKAEDQLQRVALGHVPHAGAVCPPLMCGALRRFFVFRYVFRYVFRIGSGRRNGGAPSHFTFIFRQNFPPSFISRRASGSSLILPMTASGASAFPYP